MIRIHHCTLFVETRLVNKCKKVVFCDHNKKAKNISVTLDNPTTDFFRAAAFFIPNA
jgi:hypothetical protein